MLQELQNRTVVLGIQPLSGEVVYSKRTESHISLQHGAPLHSPNHKGGQVECNCLQKKLQRATNSQSLDIWTLKTERDSNHDGRWQSRRNRALLKGNVNYVAAARWTKNTGGLWDNSSSLWLQGCWVRRRGTRCQSRCLRASDCEPWTSACNCSSLSVHVPTVISTALCGRGHKRFALKAVPKIWRPTLRPRCGDFLLGWLAGIIQDTLENVGNLSELIEQNMNIFAYSSLVKL